MINDDNIRVATSTEDDSNTVYAKQLQALRDGIEDPRPDPNLDLVSLAFGLRGNIDGSAEGICSIEELRLIYRYIEARLDYWTPNRCGSDAAIQAFLYAVLAETEETLNRWVAG